jgi:phytoene desaturase
VRLASDGNSVTVVEKNSRPGGKMGEIRRNGFRFDTGPSLFTLPQLVDELLQYKPTHEASTLKYQKLKTICRYFYDDGTCINAYANPHEFAKEIEIQTGEPAQNIVSYLDHNKALYNASANLFIFNPLNKLLNAAHQLKASTLKPLLGINPLRTMHGENKQKFRSSHIIQLFDRYATYNGSSPYLASSMLNVISHLEHNTGAYYPQKGMYDIAETIYKKALGMGVNFEFDTKVTGLNFTSGKITGITTPNKTIAANYVISDVDVNTFYRTIAEDIKTPRQVKKPDLSSSALIFYWGMNRVFPELEVHNILFSKQYQQEFESLFRHHKLFNDPTVYLFISSKIVKADAPRGNENWFVMINVPPINNENQDILKHQARKTVINKIKQILKIDPEPHILFEEVATPQTIQDYTGSYKGALYGNNSNALWSAFLRHQNRSRQHKNLFFTGGSVHPGGGIPLCLASAEIIEKQMSEE